MDGKRLHCMDIGVNESNQTNAPAAGTLVYAHREPSSAPWIGASCGIEFGPLPGGVWAARPSSS